MKSLKKEIYMANTNRSKLLGSYYYYKRLWVLCINLGKDTLLLEKRVFVVRDHDFMYVLQS